ncbi:MAG: single-stranded DNA-binding protein [Aureispira sp.]|nr:single-stranded DNA-binding protein [Aureispira sp.]
MVNRVTLIGRLGKDPELRTLPSGASYVRFSLATNESFKDKDGEWQDATEWHNIIMWRQMAERAEKQLKKGGLVYIEGKLTHRSWQDQDGNTKNMTEVKAMTYKSLERRESTGGGGYTPPPPPEENASSNNNTKAETTIDDSADDDLPF